MFTLEEYKKGIINLYYWERDNTNEERNKRKILLDNIYGDEYLKQIIVNTEEFVYYLIDKMIKENKSFRGIIYAYVDLENERASDILNSIDLDLGGGFPSDSLIYLEKDKPISMKLLKIFFEGFQMECACEEKDIYNEEEGAGHIEEDWYFHISGPTKKFNELKEKARNIKEKELVNTLKRIRTNKEK